MNSAKNSPSAEEAKTALNAIVDANKIAEDFIRPPLWFRLLLTILLGLITMAGALSSGSSLWTFVCLASVIGACIGFLVYYFYMKGIGIQLRLNPVTRSEKWFSFIASLTIAFVIILGIELTKSGYLWAPYICGLANGVLALYQLNNFSAAGGKLKGDQL